MTISAEKETALRQILVGYANDDVFTTGEAVQAVLGLLGYDTGKTLRDEFAMAAMIGLLTREFVISSREDKQAAGRVAYNFADAMMEARKK